MKNIRSPLLLSHTSFSICLWIVFTLLLLSHKVLAVDGQLKTTQASTYQHFDWTLNNMNDEAITLSNYQGKPVILVFWATWCPYCKKLLPGIAQLQKKYQQKGLTVIAVNIKEDGEPKSYWQEHGYQFDTVLNGDDIAEHYQINGTPAVVFIAPDGEVLNTAYFSDPEHPSLEKFAHHYLP